MATCRKCVLKKKLRKLAPALPAKYGVLFSSSNVAIRPPLPTLNHHCPFTCFISKLCCLLLGGDKTCARIKRYIVCP